MRFLFLLLGLASTFSVYAWECEGDCECEGYSRLFIGGQAYYYRLEIEGSGSPFTGCLGGAVAGYEYKKPDNLYAVLQASYAQGSIHTHGTGNNKRSVNDGLLETRVGYHWAFTDCCTWFLTPYTGAGFHWNRQHRYPGTLAGLTFNYYKVYIPLGLALNYVPNEIVDVGLDFEWMPDVLSMVSLSNLNGSFWELKRMSNYRIQLPCLFTVAGCYEIGITPFWMHWWDGASIAVTSGGMPLGLAQQMTDNWGGILSIGVHF